MVNSSVLIRKETIEITAVVWGCRAAAGTVCMAPKFGQVCVHLGGKLRERRARTEKRTNFSFLDPKALRPW